MNVLTFATAALGCWAAWGVASVTAVPASLPSAEFDCSTAFICPKTYMPVCDEEGRMYSNLCMMLSQSCDDGEWRSEVPCPLNKGKKEAGELLVDYEVVPVEHSAQQSSEVESDSDPWVSAAQGSLNSRSMGRDGESDGDDNECSEKCYKIYKPVCGADGYMYANLCLLEVQACRTGKPIETVDCNKKKQWKTRTEEEIFGRGRED